MGRLGRSGFFLFFMSSKCRFLGTREDGLCLSANASNWSISSSVASNTLKRLIVWRERESEGEMYGRRKRLGFQVPFPSCVSRAVKV